MRFRYLLLSCLLGTQVVMADELNDTYYPLIDVEQFDSFLSLTVGPNFVEARGEDRTLSLLPSFQNHYTFVNHGQTTADFGAMMGIEHALTPRFRGQIGISAYADTSFQFMGNVLKSSPTQSEVHSFRFSDSSRRIMITGKILSNLAAYQCLLPFFSWEVGVGFNEAYQYHERPLTTSVIQMKPFNSDSQSAVAWGVGFGVDYIISRHIRAGIGYQFTNLGTVSLGLASDQVTTQTLRISNLYANQLRLQMIFMV